MGRISKRADRLVQRVFRPNRAAPVRSEKITDLTEKLDRRRNRILKMRRGL